MQRVVLALGALALSAHVALAQGQTHKIAFQVDQNDPQVMNLTLNNVQNAIEAFAGMGDKVDIEVVAYGPGLNMFIKGKSPVAERIGAMSLEHPDVVFSACGNTLAKMEQATGHKIPLLSEAHVVPGGVVRLTELQEQGYAYIRP